MKAVRYRLAIALLGKGSTNHLHRREVVDAFHEKGIEVRFLVRDDYLNILTRLEDCHYTPVSFKGKSGFRVHFQFFCEYIRNLYPSQDPGRKVYFDLISRYKPAIRFQLLDRLCKFLARFRGVVHAMMTVEGLMAQPDTVEGLDPADIDQLLLLGIGTVSSELEGHMAWWAKRQNIPIVNIIGNYDNLTSKGYRGVPIDSLLVWGPNMEDDAVRYHGIEREKVTQIGSIRYNMNPQLLSPDKHEFLRSLGLDPHKKTILFAGFFFEFHYFEMMEVYRQLVQNGTDCQVILRVYPNKILMSSVFMAPLLHYARQCEGVYVSLGDPAHTEGAKNKSVLQIEEYELWNSLNCCDCVVNIFSTISLEACIFDKPAINMYYFPEPFPGLARAPLYYDYEKLFHSRRLVSYGAITTTRNRDDLIGAIRDALMEPARLKGERKKTVEEECGVLDGGACRRLVAACVEDYQKRTTVQQPYHAALLTEEKNEAR